MPAPTPTENPFESGPAAGDISSVLPQGLLRPMLPGARDTPQAPAGFQLLPPTPVPPAAKLPARAAQPQSPGLQLPEGHPAAGMQQPSEDWGWFRPEMGKQYGRDPVAIEWSKQLGLDPQTAGLGLLAQQYLDGAAAGQSADMSESYRRFFQMPPDVRSAYRQYQNALVDNWSRGSGSPAAMPGGSSAVPSYLTGEQPQGVWAPADNRVQEMWDPQRGLQLLEADAYPGLDAIANRLHFNLNDPKFHTYWNQLQQRVNSGQQPFPDMQQAMRGYWREQDARRFRESPQVASPLDQAADERFFGYRRDDPRSGQEVMTVPYESLTGAIDPTTGQRMLQVGENPEGWYGAGRDAITGAYAAPVGVAQWLATGDSSLMTQAGRSVMSPFYHATQSEPGWNAQLDNQELAGIDRSVDIGRNIPTTRGLSGSTYDPVTGELQPGALRSYGRQFDAVAADPNQNPVIRALAHPASAAANYGPDVLAAYTGARLLGMPPTMGNMMRTGAAQHMLGDLADNNPDDVSGLLGNLGAGAEGYFKPIAPQFAAARGVLHNLPGSDTYYDAADSLRTLPGADAPAWQRGLAETGASTMEILPEFLLAGGGAAGLNKLRQHGLAGLQQLPGQASNLLRQQTAGAILRNPHFQMAAGTAAGQGLDESGLYGNQPWRQEHATDQLARPDDTTRMEHEATRQQIGQIEHDIEAGIPVEDERIERLRQSDPAEADRLDRARNASPLTGAVATAQEMLANQPEQAMEIAAGVESDIVGGPLATDNGLALVQDTLETGEVPPDVQDAARDKLEEAGYDAGSIQQILGELSPTQHLLLWGGLSLGAIGLISAMTGGGLESWLLAVLGLGTAAATGAHAGMLGEQAQEFTQNALQPGNYMDYLPDWAISKYMQSLGPEHEILQNLDRYNENRGGLVDWAGLVDREIGPKLEQYGMTREQLDRLADLRQQQLST